MQKDGKIHVTVWNYVHERELPENVHAKNTPQGTLQDREVREEAGGFPGGSPRFFLRCGFRLMKGARWGIIHRVGNTREKRRK